MLQELCFPVRILPVDLRFLPLSSSTPEFLQRRPWPHFTCSSVYLLHGLLSPVSLCHPRHWPQICHLSVLPLSLHLRCNQLLS